MTELEKYEAVNKCETFQELADVIMSFADEDGYIAGRNKQFDAKLMAGRCLHFNNSAPNNLTRQWGIRQQAFYIQYYGK